MGDFFETVSHQILRVCNGSGVLLSPAYGAYSYVVTAKHNFENDNNVGSYLELKDICVKDFSNNDIYIVDKLLHPTQDIAVLVTERRFESPILFSQEHSKGNSVCVVGYPYLRDKELGESQLREYPGQINRVNSAGYLSVTLEEKPDKSQLDGVSGGGLFREQNGQILLCGIQSRIEGVVDEYHGRVICIQVECINEILKTISVEKGYAPIYPAHLHSFSHLENKIFPFDSVQTSISVEYLKSVLRVVAADLRTKKLPSPIEIYQKYRSSLLVGNAPKDDAFQSTLWATYLEFLVVASIIDETKALDFSYLDDSRSKRRFLFSATNESWTTLLLDIYSSDFRGLAKGGAIIVSTRDKNSASHMLTKLTLDKVITNIGRRQFGDMQIDSPMSNPAQEFKLFHWSGLHQQCVVSKEDEYAEYSDGKPGLDLEALLKKIKVEYNAFI